MIIDPEEDKFPGLLKNMETAEKSMDEADLHAFIGLLILAGVNRSWGEAASSLWDAEEHNATGSLSHFLKNDSVW